jgi:hypothetical protein
MAVIQGKYSTSPDKYLIISNGFKGSIRFACANENASLIICARFLIGIAFKLKMKMIL